jgi:maltose O-acetyltransferase
MVGGRASRAAGAGRTGRAGRTQRRLVVHLLHLVASQLLGDDALSRRLRVGLLRAAGATVGAGSAFHGGTWFSEPRNLRVGADCFVNRSCYLDLEGLLTIGDRVTIGHGTSILTSRHTLGGPEQRAGRFEGVPVSVGSGAWIGANVTVLPGVVVGPGAVVAAGAVVTADVPPDTVVAGVPARVLRTLDAATSPGDPGPGRAVVAGVRP